MLEFPLEYAMVVFQGNKFTGDIIPELLDLVDRGIVRFVDIVFIQKDENGSTHTLELNDLDEDLYRMFVPLGKHVANLYTEDDLAWAASRLPENSSAALFLWEDLWMENISRAVVASGGVLTERGQIPQEVVEEFKKQQAAG